MGVEETVPDGGFADSLADSLVAFGVGGAEASIASSKFPRESARAAASRLAFTQIDVDQKSPDDGEQRDGDSWKDRIRPPSVCC